MGMDILASCKPHVFIFFIELTIVNHRMLFSSSLNLMSNLVGIR